jgi:urease accessory protein
VDPHRPAARVGRDGTLSLRAERRGAATVLAGCRFTLPLQVLAPLALGDDVLVVSMLNPTGAVLAGDRLRIDVRAAAGARVLLTTPSATKVHRSDGPMATQDVDLVIEEGATVEWIPDHTIPFAGAAYRQRLHAHVGPGASLIVADAFAAGRVARCERWRFRHLDSALLIEDDDGWLLHDRLVLSGEGAWGELGFAEGAPYFATIAVVTDAPFEAVARATAGALEATSGARAGVGRLPRRGILVRCLADTAPALGEAVQAVWQTVRTTALGLAPVDLRKY